METTTQERKPKKPRLEMDLESMERIENWVDQWRLMEEHWTTNNLNRHLQLEQAQAYFREIKKEIKMAYENCRTYADAE